MLGKLIVRVYKAEGLAAGDMNGKSDPFIKMQLVNQYHRTSTQYKTLDPEWNEMFHFNVLDVHNQLDFWVFDEDRHGEDFLGRLMVPLLSIKNKKMIWYQLKDKKMQNNVKGRLLLRMDLEYSTVAACLRTFNPLEELKHQPAAQLKRTVMISNFMRVKTHVVILLDILKYVRSCFEWQFKLRSLNAFVTFLVVTYYFQLWMFPLVLLCILSFNWCIIRFPTIRDFFGFDQVKYSTLTDIRHMLASDCSLDEDQLGAWGDSASGTGSASSTTTTTRSSCILTSCISPSSSNLTGCILSSSSSSNSNSVTSTASANNNGNDDDSAAMSLVERLQAGKDIVILIQDILGHIASYLERISNTFTFKVPFLSYLMMACLATASVLLYFVPLRYIILAWGINKFTKKLRNPNAVDNNELIDFLSRVPDDLQCIKVKNTISY